MTEVMSMILQEVQDKSEIFEISIIKSHKMNNRKIIFLVEGDPLDVFIQSDKFAKSRFLFSLQKGCIFPLDLPDEQENLYITSQGKSKIVTIDQDCITDLCAQNENLNNELSLLLNIWVDLLSGLISLQPSDSEEYLINVGQHLDIPKNGVLFAQKNLEQFKEDHVFWLQVEEGNLLYNGKENCPIPKGSIFPMNQQQWCLANVDSKVFDIDTKEIIKRKEWVSGLAIFYKVFLTHIFEVFFQDEQKYAKISEGRNLEEQKNLDASRKKILSLFQEVPEFILDVSNDPLEQSLKAISSFMKFSFVFPKQESEAKSVHEKIHNICEASGIRKRKVKISSDFWKKDQGPLLGFDKKTNTPVALITSKGGGYQMHHPLYKNVVKLDKNNVKDIDLSAYMFYIPFDSSIKSIFDIVKYLTKNYISQAIPLLIYSFFAIIISFFPSIATDLLFTYAIPENNSSLVYYLTMGLLNATLGYCYFYFLRSFALLRLTGVVTHLIQTAVWDRVLKLPVKFFRNFTIGNLLWRIVAVDEVQNTLGVHSLTALISGGFSILYFFVMLYFSPNLTLIVALLTAINIALIYVCFKYKVSLMRKAYDLQGKIKGLLLQIISGVGKLRIAGAEKSAFATWSKLYVDNKSLIMKSAHIQNVATTSYIFIPMFTTGLIYLYLHFLGPQMLPLPKFLAFNIAFGSFTLSLIPLYDIVLSFTELLPLLERTNTILEEPMENVTKNIPPGTLSGSIRLDNISFSYSADIQPVLKNVSMNIKPREFIGIVGPSGCGKSTLIRLLLGFEKPSSGAIYFDNKDLASVDITAVRKQLGVVFQREGIIAGSIYDNLVCGGFYTIDQIKNALKLSEFEGDLEMMPMGLHTVLPMNGETLSGGQKQRLLLARALLANPSILILDEATSALDNKTQQRISDNIAKLNSTRIIVAQRLSTIRHADTIYVLEEGKIVQKGSFDELIKMPGLFAQMYERQKL